MDIYLSARARILRAADSIGAGETLRGVRQAVAPHSVRRDAADNRIMTAILAAALGAEDNALDVGANSGVHLATMLRCAPLGHHVAYEPVPHLGAKLTQDFPAVDVRRAALGAQEGFSTFVHVPSAPAYSGFHRQDYPKDFEVELIEVPVQTLDGQFANSWRPHVIKLDVEGAEFDVLSGGVNLIHEAQPLIIFEFFAGSARYYGTSPENVHELVCADFGYRLFDIDGNGPYTAARLREQYEEGRIWTFIARP